MKQKDNAILNLTIDFSIAIISFVEELESKRKFVVANQLLKSGTSIGANVHEADSYPTSDFKEKLQVIIKNLSKIIASTKNNLKTKVN